MYKNIIKLTDAYKRQPHTVQKITMRQVGSKFNIEIHMDGSKPKTIGRYDSRQEAHDAMVQLSALTNSEIIK